MSKELIANLGVVSRCLSNGGYPNMSLIVERASEALSHLPDREEVARVLTSIRPHREEVLWEAVKDLRMVAALNADKDPNFVDGIEHAISRILSLMERKA